MRAHVEVSPELKDLLVKAFEKVVGEYSTDYSTLYDWYITSVSQRDEPVWTEKHLKELMSDFYLIPKDISDRYKGSKK
ncbi:MAG: hypothetical protein II518_04995 [Candidatus Methanomethylophilus sp.]|nr:hypothetical protein [Methanomethylophilus sp.]